MRTNLCRCFDCFSTKRADFGLFGFGHKLYVVFFPTGFRRAPSKLEFVFDDAQKLIFLVHDFVVAGQ